MKAIVFDVDGVLLRDKDEFGNYLWLKNIQTDLGLSADQVRLIYSDDWSLVLKGIISAQEYFKAMFKKLNIGLPVEEFIEYWLKHDLIINTEMVPVLESIKGPKLYIGTNQDCCRTMVLQKMFKHYFDRIFSSYQIGVTKSDPEFFRYIESILSIDSADIAFIDDSKNHIEVATNLGWTCHHYKNIEGLKNFIKNL
jgi:putative hydrolase of the HAD superfamily